MLLTFSGAEFVTEYTAEPLGVLVAGGCLVAVAGVLGEVADAPGHALRPGEHALGVELVRRLTSLPGQT